MLNTVSKIMEAMGKISLSKIPTIPILQLQGPVTRQMSIYVSQMLKKVHKGHSHLAVIVNCKGGSFAQAHIISQLLKNKAKQQSLQIHTFAQQFALNAGMMVLMSGNQVYMDSTTVIGGLQCGQKLYRTGKISDFITTVNYYKQKSYAGGVQFDGQISQHKKQEVRKIYQEFSTVMSDKIVQSRGQKTKNINLMNFYSSNQALQNGLIDSVDRVYNVIARLQPKAKVTILKQSKLQQIKATLKNMKAEQYKAEFRVQ